MQQNSKLFNTCVAENNYFDISISGFFKNNTISKTANITINIDCGPGFTKIRATGGFFLETDESLVFSIECKKALSTCKRGYVGSVLVENTKEEMGICSKITSPYGNFILSEMDFSNNDRYFFFKWNIYIAKQCTELSEVEKLAEDLKLEKSLARKYIEKIWLDYRICVESETFELSGETIRHYIKDLLSRKRITFSRFLNDLRGNT